MKTISLTFLIFILTSCVSLQGQKLNPETALQDIQSMIKAGNIDQVQAYFSEHGSLYPDGLAAGQHEQPSIYLGNENKLMTFNQVKHKFNEQNQIITQLKSQCANLPNGLQKMRCLTSSNSPCSSNRDVGCTVKENKNNGSGTGTFDLNSIGSVASYLPFITSDNLNWYTTEVESSVVATNKNREIEVSSKNDESQKLSSEYSADQKKWDLYCKKNGIKAVFKAHVEPINKFDSNGIFSFVSVGSQHCIGNKFNDRFQYLNYCPGNRNRTCGVIYGLNGRQSPGQLISNVTLAFTKYMKGSDESGLEDSKFAGLRVISENDLIKEGLK